MGLIKAGKGVDIGEHTTATAGFAFWIELHPFLEHLLLVLFAETST